MNLYLVSQDVNNDYDTYDTYDSFVIACETEEEARNTSPDGGQMTPELWKRPFSSWCSSPDHVEIQFIGKAAEGITGVICASFNAG